MPTPPNNRLRVFPDRQAPAACALQCRTPRYPKAAAATLYDPIRTVRRNAYRGRSVSST